MKLVRYDGGRIGVLQDGVVHDATDAVGLDATLWPPVGMVQPIKNFDRLRSSLFGYATTLCPGDVIATGTPVGVGPIKAGDVITVEIERVGPDDRSRRTSTW